jgi:phage tail-like protein
MTLVRLGAGSRYDPYRNFSLRLFDGNRIYFGTKATGLNPPPPVAQYRAGNDPLTVNKLPGRAGYSPVTLHRGVVQNTSFSDWASSVWNFGSSLGSEVSLANFRKNFYLEFYNEAGQLAISYRIYRTMVLEIPARAGLGVSFYPLQRRPDDIQTQLAALFESGLKRSTA